MGVMKTSVKWPSTASTVDIQRRPVEKLSLVDIDQYEKLSLIDVDQLKTSVVDVDQ